MEHGEAEMVDLKPSPSAAGSLALLTKEEMLWNLEHAFSQKSPWIDAWVSPVDRLDVTLLVDWPAQCSILTKRCLLCDARPPS